MLKASRSKLFLVCLYSKISDVCNADLNFTFLLKFLLINIASILENSTINGTKCNFFISLYLSVTLQICWMAASAVSALPLIHWEKWKGCHPLHPATPLLLVSRICLQSECGRTRYKETRGLSPGMTFLSDPLPRHYLVLVRLDSRFSCSTLKDPAVCWERNDRGYWASDASRDSEMLLGFMNVHKWLCSNPLARVMLRTILTRQLDVDICVFVSNLSTGLCMYTDDKCF